jgi:hypothetical protein
MLPVFKHQGPTAEKSTLQQFNQSVYTDVLKSTKEIREGNKKINMPPSKYHQCLSA